MINHKNILLSFVGIEVFLIILHKVIDEGDKATGLNMPWHFWLPLIFGVLTVIFAYSIKCPSPTCGARQVFRGMSIADIRWPKSKCYCCGTPLSKEHKNEA